MDLVEISRLQFGSTAAFHIVWPLMSVGLAFFIVIMETLWYTTAKEIYYRQVRFWLKIFVLTFAIGVASGLPLSIQFGTNWSTFATTAGAYFGNLLGFETTVAFTLETAFLGLMVFGWGKVSPRAIHLFASFMVLFGASLSAFWIMAANSWMQIPRGIHFENGLAVVDSYKQAIVNIPVFVSFAHMWMACIATGMFMIAGIAAWSLLRKDISETVQDFFARSFRFALGIALVTACAQLLIGDASGLVVAKDQPEKLAAIELHWDTNAAGTGAAWSLFALPALQGGHNVFSIEVPSMLSGMITHTMTGQVRGLNDFPATDRPSVRESVAVYYMFRVMVLVGICMILLSLWGLWYWYTGTLKAEHLIQHRSFLTVWVAGIPLGFIATEAGWMVREIGRQPWVIYHVMRTYDGLSNGLQAPLLWGVIGGIVVLYVVAIVGFIVFTYRIVRTGPDLEAQVPWKV